MRIKATIAYDGSRFMGFQCQKHTKETVMGHLYRAARSLGIESRIIGSGRTDRGVHATAQVVHFDVPAFWEDLDKLHVHLARKLMPFIQIRHLQMVPDDFHARYSATRRAYRYIISPKAPSPFEAAYVTHARIEPAIVQEALKIFEGEHDFRYFMKTGSDVKSSVRTIYKARLYHHKGYDIFYFEADGFLRAQIRMMVQFLFELSLDRLALWQLKMQLEGKERFCTSLAPPNGLYLCRVVYPTNAALM